MSTLSVAEILKNYKKICVVGLSPNEDRPSHQIAAYLIDQGYEVCGVNPAHKSILGVPVYPNLSAVPGPLEIVDVFRSSEYIADLVEELLPLKPKVLWLQLGVHDAAAEEKAEQNGMALVTDKCILVEHRKFF